MQVTVLATFSISSKREVNNSRCKKLELFSHHVKYVLWLNQGVWATEGIETSMHSKNFFIGMVCNLIWDENIPSLDLGTWTEVSEEVNDLKTWIKVGDSNLNSSLSWW